MTLQEWAEKYNEVVTKTEKGNTCVQDKVRDSKSRLELYHLSDYSVGSVRAGTIWLEPRMTREQFNMGVLCAMLAYEGRPRRH